MVAAEHRGAVPDLSVYDLARDVQRRVLLMVPLVLADSELDILVRRPGSHSNKPAPVAEVADRDVPIAHLPYRLRCYLYISKDTDLGYVDQAYARDPAVYGLYL